MANIPRTATDPATPDGPVAKLQLLERLVHASPSIYPQTSRDAFLVLIWLVLADLGAMPVAPVGKAV